MRVHLKPTIGSVKLDRLNALQVQTMYRQKLDGGLYARTVGIIHATLYKALRQAVRWSLVPHNVAEAVTPPRPVRREVAPLTSERAQSLLDAARGDKLEALYILAVTTGMRQGELLGLQWKDVDLEGGTIKVNQSVYEGVVSPPKTSAARRTVRLSKLVVAALKRHKINADRMRMSEWVFTTAKGTAIGHQNLRNRSWKPLLRRAGLPHSVRFHDLRHTAASIMLGQNVPLPVVSYVLGHANPSITAALYSHMLENMSGRGADGMDDALG